MKTSFEDVMRGLATLSALYLCVSPLSVVNRIIRQRNVESASILPLVTLWVCNHLWMLYGYVVGDLFPVFTAYAIGDALSVIFLAIYLRFATDRTAVVKPCFSALLCNAAVTLYVVLGMHGAIEQRRDTMTTVIGILAVASSLALYASPLAAIKVVLQTQSAAPLPFPMILAGVVNNVLWIVYGFLVVDLFLVVPCSVNVFLGLVQVALYGRFHPSRSTVNPSSLCQSPKDELSELNYLVMEPTTPLQATQFKESLSGWSIDIKESPSLITKSP